MIYSKAMIRKTATPTGFRGAARIKDGICISNLEGVKLRLEKS